MAKTSFARCVTMIAVAAVTLIALDSLAADWKEDDGFRSAPLAVAAAGKSGFTRMLSESGITFTNTLPESRHITNQILLNGSGVAAGDIDGDGHRDLYFCRLEGPNALYRNRGDWKFEAVADAGGAACANIDSTAAAFADLDGDRDVDLIVNSIGGGTHVFFNDGKGRFTPAVAPLNSRKGGMSLAVGDVDGDGLLDFYVANYRTSALMDMPNARAWFKRVDGRTVIEKIDGRFTTEPDLTNRFIVTSRGGIDELGEVDVLFRNVGGTNFTDVPFTGGAFLDEAGQSLTSAPFEWGLSVAFRDLNNDRHPDIYVCNDFTSGDRLWLSTGKGTFQSCPPLAIRKQPQFSMGVDFADVNRDGFDDFFALDMPSRDHVQRMRQMPDTFPAIATVGKFDDRPQFGFNMLFLNRGDGTYAEIGHFSGVAAAEWAWMPLFLDVDLDGWEDLLISNGQERAARDFDIAETLKKMRAQRTMSDAEIFEARKLFPRLATANLAFRNRGDLKFDDVSNDWGFDFAGVSHGMALADLDNDGDLDVVVNNLNDLAGVYRNDSIAPRLAVRLKGRAPNTFGIGARITVIPAGAKARPTPAGAAPTDRSALPVQTQEIICGSRYLSSDEPMRSFAAGSLTNEFTIQVVWRSGATSIIDHAKANRVYEINEPQASGRQPQLSAEPEQPLFEDVSDQIKHTHAEQPFDDFARQALLPYNLSQFGPGVLWTDLNGDAWDDLVIGSGKGGRLAAFRNDTGRGFQRLTEAPFTQPAMRDQTTVLPIASRTGVSALLVGSSNYEDGLTIGASVHLFDVADKTVKELLPATEASTGPLSMADIDGDGDLDLFVGCNVSPGKYPQAASSTLFKNDGGAFRPDDQNVAALSLIGLVKASLFSDIDGDGDPDLVLACDWGPIRVLRNDKGRFTQATSELGFDKYIGWWNGVATGDFNNDGRIDLVAANWGENTGYEMYRPGALQVYFGDFDGDSSFDVFEAYDHAQLKKPVSIRLLNDVAHAMPFVRERFPTHKAFGQATAAEILGDGFTKARRLEARWLSSTVFLNRGDKFEAKALPPEAQWAPAFGVTVADFDGDGADDIFLAQNFFAMARTVPRNDAGRGLLLRGDGKGGFESVSGSVSGIEVYGEQRGCAAADFDRDGRSDLVVTQNGAATRMFRNKQATPGLRVRLAGTDPNPAAVGAVIRMGTADHPIGPAHEIHSGAGWWSTDSPVAVLARTAGATHVHVRWPGGATSRVAIPDGAKEIAVSENGSVKPTL